MGREDVDRALRAMDDEETRERLSQGDFEAASGLELTDEERTLVREAAGDYPDVAGFSFDVFQQESIAMRKAGKGQQEFLSEHLMVGVHFKQAALYARGG
jgi:hypothetical protein